MNPSSNEAGNGLQLPTPVEQSPATTVPAEIGQAPVEQGPGSAAESAPPALAAPALPLPSIPLPTPTPLPSSTSQNDVTATTQTNGVQLADDGDLIEKEWVNKAKAIVERNREDPYKQSEEITVFRADYMQKRYNKTIKLNK